jgi:hypothetical protein
VNGGLISRHPSESLAPCFFASAFYPPIQSV